MKKTGGGYSRRPACMQDISGLQILAEISADSAHLANDIVDIQNHFHHTALLIINSGVNFFLNLRLTCMINRKSQLDSCQWTSESRVTSSYGFSCKTCSFAFSSTKNNNDVFCTVFFGQIQYPFLIL